MGRKIICFSEAGFPIYDDEMTETWLTLVNAILNRAVTDYVDIYRKMLRARNEDQVRKLQEEKDELEEFFYSDWHEELAGSDGRDTVRRLREIAIRKEKELINRQEEKRWR